MADQSEANLQPLLDRFWMHCTTHMHAFLIKSIHHKPSVTFSAIPHTKFYLQCKIWDKFFVRYSYSLEKSRSTLEINWQYRALWTNLPGLEVWNRNFPIDGACHQFRDRTTASAAPSSPSSSRERFSVDNNPSSIYQCIYYKHQHVEFCAYELQFADSTGFLLSLEEKRCRIASNACRSLRWTFSWQNAVFRVV